jgi:hypothetical protein|tara:strand:- start:4863 stop:5057 length:195 start_codon:yes stop_codon:yes gene_type:complete
MDKNENVLTHVLQKLALIDSKLDILLNKQELDVKEVFDRAYGIDKTAKVVYDPNIAVNSDISDR